MYQRDYLLRLIEQMSQFIGQVIFKLKKAEKYEEALEELDTLLHRLHLPKGRLLRTLLVEDIVALISRDGHAEPDKLYAVAVILKEQADICAGLRQEEAQWAAGTRSLHFYCMWHRLTDRQQSLDEAEQLYDDYKDYELPAELLEEIALYFERTHAFARSEDLWFDLCRIDDEAFAAKAFAFYDRIAQLPDDALAAGNLPRGEIAQGRDAIQRIVDARSAPEHPPESRGH